MNKQILLLFVFICAISNIDAQSVVSSNYGTKSVAAKEAVKQSNTNNESSETNYRDFTFGISDSGNTISLNTGFSNKDDLGYGVVGLGVCTGGLKGVALSLGYGLHYRSVGDSFLFLGYVYPYLGCSYLYNKLEDKSKLDFDYGASGGAKVGYNVYTSAKGSKHYVTIGYGVNASQFKTKDLFKNGAWQLGLTVEM